MREYPGLFLLIVGLGISILAQACSSGSSVDTLSASESLEGNILLYLAFSPTLEDCVPLVLSVNNRGIGYREAVEIAGKWRLRGLRAPLEKLRQINAETKSIMLPRSSKAIGFITPDSRRAILLSGEPRAELERQYPGSCQVTSFSRPVVFAEGGRALVYASYTQGPTSASSHLLLLERDSDGSWIHRESISLYES